jgi:hypothetical protein
VRYFSRSACGRKRCLEPTSPPQPLRSLSVAPPDTHRRFSFNLRCVSGGATERLRCGTGGIECASASANGIATCVSDSHEGGDWFEIGSGESRIRNAGRRPATQVISVTVSRCEPSCLALWITSVAGARGCYDGYLFVLGAVVGVVTGLAGAADMLVDSTWGGMASKFVPAGGTTAGAAGVRGAWLGGIRPGAGFPV